MSIHLTADHGGDDAEQRPRPIAAPRRPATPGPLVLISHSWVTVTRGDSAPEIPVRRAA